MTHRVRRSKVISDSEESASYRYFQHMGRADELRRFQHRWFWDDLPASVRKGIEREMDHQDMKATLIKIEELD